ncbi:triose-phosphate isomerase [Azospirillum formosense]
MKTNTRDNAHINKREPEDENAMAARRKLIAGNWKMNGLKADGLDLASDLAGRLTGAGTVAFDMLVCPPFPLLFPVGDAISGSPLALGAQDCHAKTSGAHTGDVSPAMLTDAGCRYVILGHSERRADHAESDAQVAAKAAAAHKAGLIAIICVGETEAQRDAGQANAVVASQLKGSIPEGATAANTVIAYEPVWAIGTGKTATPDDVKAMHAHIRAELAGKTADPEAVRVLYGGSVKPGNAAELMAVENVDGALVGGAALKADDFWAIATSCR